MCERRKKKINVKKKKGGEAKRHRVEKKEGIVLSVAPKKSLLLTLSSGEQKL